MPDKEDIRSHPSEKPDESGLEPELTGPSETEPASPRKQRRVASDDGQRWKGGAFALVAVLITGFGTGIPLWALAFSLSLVSVLLVACPPSVRLPLFARTCLLVLCLVPLLSFLPESWAGTTPAWRASLTATWDIPLPSTITPQPWATAGAILFLWIGAGFWSVSLTQGHGQRARRLGIQILAIGISLVCVASVAEARDWISIDWWPRNKSWGNGFGPFANRNHLGTLASAGCVLTFGCVYDALRRRSGIAIVFLIAVVPILLAIVENTSRAGLLLTFIGLTTWVGFVAMRKGLIRKLAVGMAVILVGIALVIISGSSLASRLGFSDQGDGMDLGSATRLALYQDSLRLFAESPWAGVGLGNFEAIYNHIGEVKSPMVRYLHPESDFFQLLVEGGLLPVIAVGLLALWLFFSTGPWQRFGDRKNYDRLDRRLRQSAAIAAGLMVLHAIVDVPLHGLRFFVIFACICSFAIRPRAVKQPMGLWGRSACRLMGVGLMAIAATLVALPGGTLHPVFGKMASEHAYRASARELNQGRLAEGAAHLERAMKITPLDWRLYAMRARVAIAQGRGASQAILDFGRARALESSYSAMCYDEGVFWLNIDPRLAIPAWREFLARDQRRGREDWYRQMVHLSLSHPEIRDDLWDLADSPSLKLVYLDQNLPPERWEACLKSLLQDRPDLSGLSADQKRRLFRSWHQRGDREQLMVELASHEEWLEFGWDILAQHLASKSQFREAYELAIDYLPPPTVPTTHDGIELSKLESSFVFSPTDPRRGMELYWAQKAQGLFDEAILTLNKLANLPQAPTYLPQEFASVYAAKGEYRQAWEYLSKVPRSG